MKYNQFLSEAKSKWDLMPSNSYDQADDKQLIKDLITGIEAGTVSDVDGMIKCMQGIMGYYGIKIQDTLQSDEQQL